MKAIASTNCHATAENVFKLYAQNLNLLSTKGIKVFQKLLIDLSWIYECG